MTQDTLNYSARLDFDKILAAISELAVCEDAKRDALKVSPCDEVYPALEQLELTDSLYVMLIKNSRPPMSPVEGIGEICLRAEKGGTLSMAELLRVKTMLANARLMHAWYSGDGGSDSADRLMYMLYEDASLERDIASSILSDSEMSDDASGELRSIRRQILKTESSIRDKLDSIIHSSESQRILQDAIVTMRGGRFVVPVKQEHRGAVEGLVHDVSSSGGTYFVEPQAVVDANNKIMQLRGDELKEIERILLGFSERVAACAGQLRESYNSYLKLDLALAKAKYSLSIDGVRPVLNDEGRINLKRARHPLIPKKDAVPIDVRLGDDFTTLVITGPNTGGKTVTLKTVGLLSLMASSGILIPAAESSELCVFRSVLVDIGDEQSIEQSLSTFSAHIKNIAEILKVADDGALVLLDELGAGTDPAEGAALAVAILERLKSLGCRVLATTHYGEIKLYAIERDGVQNASCEFDVATLRPTYRLTIGAPGRSNALLICERLGLDSALIESARGNMGADERRFEAVMGELEDLKAETARREREITEMREQASALVEEAKKERRRLIEQGQKELDSARVKARGLSNDVAASAYRLLDEIKRLDKLKERDRDEAKRRAREIAAKDSVRLTDGLPDERAAPDTLEPVGEVKSGERVYILPLAAEGEVVSPPNAKGETEVRSGLIKTRVHVSQLRRPAAHTAVKKQVQRGPKVDVSSNRSGKTEVNLLGMTVEEALMEVDRFIDGALLSHISTVYLIHGKGTGALRSAVHRHLKGLKCVKAFRLGKYGEGEDGVTVCEIG